LEVAVRGGDEADVCTLALAPLPHVSPDPEEDASDRQSDQDGSVEPVRVESPDSPPAATPVSDPLLLQLQRVSWLPPLPRKLFPKKSGRADAFRMVNLDSEIWGPFFFYLTWCSPQTKPPHGGWEASCPYHRLTNTTLCKKSISLRSPQEKRTCAS
jgi:hypothetical protein